MVSLNGQPIHDLAELVARVDGCSEPYLHFDLQYNIKVGEAEVHAWVTRHMGHQGMPALQPAVIMKVRVGEGGRGVTLWASEGYQLAFVGRHTAPPALCRTPVT